MNTDNQLQQIAQDMANIQGGSLVDAQEAIQATINDSIERTRKFIVSHFYKPKYSKTEIFREQTREAMAKRFEDEKKENVDGAITVITRSVVRRTIAASLSNAGNGSVSKVAGLAPRKQRRAEARANKQAFEPKYNNN